MTIKVSPGWLTAAAASTLLWACTDSGSDTPAPDLDEGAAQVAQDQPQPASEEAAPAFVGVEASSEAADEPPEGAGEAAASELGGEASFDKAANCRTYYGGCTGFYYGTSCAQGEGWQYCPSGTSLYAWMTICDNYASHPFSYGVGYCWF